MPEPQQSERSSSSSPSSRESRRGIVQGSIYRLCIDTESDSYEVCGYERDLLPHWEAFTGGTLVSGILAITGFMYSFQTTAPYLVTRPCHVAVRGDQVVSMTLSQETTTDVD